MSVHKIIFVKLLILFFVFLELDPFCLLFAYTMQESYGGGERCAQSSGEET
jgi:hypothetical protein